MRYWWAQITLYGWPALIGRRVYTKRNLRSRVWRGFRTYYEA